MIDIDDGMEWNEYDDVDRNHSLESILFYIIKLRSITTHTHWMSNCTVFPPTVGRAIAYLYKTD